MVHADASQGSEGREHDFHPQSRLQWRGASTSMVTGSARVLRGGPPHPHPRWALPSQLLKLDRPYGERARTSEAPDGPWIVRGFAGASDRDRDLCDDALLGNHLAVDDVGLRSQRAHGPL